MGEISNALDDVIEKLITLSNKVAVLEGAEPDPDPEPEPEPGPFEPDECVLAQIEREPVKRSGGAKTAFDIIVNNLDTHVVQWIAPYKVNLGNGFGWISGDRAGYKGAYMFLVELATGRVINRVMFQSLGSASAYMQINDKYMDEIQTTGIGFDGKCGEPPTQGQMPIIEEDYEADGSPEVRPLIPIIFDGVVVEDRSYTNTVTPGTDVFRFSDLGRTTDPFMAVNGFGTGEHVVYSRQAVGGRLLVDGVWVMAVAVYYDNLDPAARFG